MIENERQYEITLLQAARFAATLEVADADGAAWEAEGVHPLLVKAMQEALASQLATLTSEIALWEQESGKNDG